MATINTMLESIVAHMQGQPNCDVDVSNFPDDWENFFLAHVTGAMLVQFGSESDSHSMDAGMMVQERQLRFGITLLFRNLNGHTGVYEYLDRLRLWLTGFKPDHCEAMRPVNSKFRSQDDGLWVYVSEFVCNSTNIQVMPPIGVANLAKVTYEDTP